MQVKPCRIQRKRTKGWRMPENAVYVGRPTKWGNPFGRWYLRFHFGLDVAVALYREMARGVWNPTLLRDYMDVVVNTAYRDQHEWRQRMGGHPLEIMRAELGGKDLACWCPLVDKNGNKVPCHADVLLELANQ